MGAFKDVEVEVVRDGDEISNKEVEITVGEDTSTDNRNRREIHYSVSDLFRNRRRRVQGKEVNEYQDMVKDIITNGYGIEIGLMLFNRSNDGLDYDILVLFHETTDKVFYFCSTLQPTGEDGLSGDDIIAILNKESNGKLLLPGVAINDEVTPFIQDELVKALKAENKEIVFLEGLVTTELTENMAEVLVESAVRIFEIATSDVTPADIYDTLNRKKDLKSKLYVYDNNKPAIEVMPNDYRRISTVIDSVLTSDSRSYYANSRSVNIKMASVGTYVSVVPYNDERDKRKYTMVPEIVINNAENESEVISTVFASIYNATALSADKAWLRVLADDVKRGKQVGMINALFHDEDGNPQPVVKFSTKDSTKDIINMLNGMIEDSPVYSMIIKSYYYGGAELSPFVELANGNYDIGYAFIEDLHDLTDGRFPIDFNPKNIISNSFDIYGGTITDGKHELPMESVDIVDVIAKTIENKSLPIDIIEDFAEAFIVGSDSVTEEDKLKIYSILGYDTLVNTVMTKIYFDGEFIDTLVDAFANTPFDATSDKFFGVDISKGRVDIDNITSAISGALTSSKRRLKTSSRDSRGRHFNYRTTRGSIRRRRR